MLSKRALVFWMVLIAPLSYVGCTSENGYHLVLLFPDKKAEEMVTEVALWVLEPTGISCNQLVSGDINPESIITQPRTILPYPSNGKPKVREIPMGDVLLYAEGRTKEGGEILRGCTSTRVTSSSAELVIELIWICTPVPEIHGNQKDDDCDGLTDECQIDADCDDADVCTKDRCIVDEMRCENIRELRPGMEGPAGDATCLNGIDEDCDGFTDIKDVNCLVCGDPSEYEARIQAEADWIESCQRDTGAICTHSDKESIIPYFSHWAAIGLFSAGRYAAVKKWIAWYLAHINHPDRWGVEGTVYDYDVVDQQEISTKDYDSADSYAAMFLYACRLYSQVDPDFFKDFQKKSALLSVADVIWDLQDGNGSQDLHHDFLVWAKPNYLVKYLMDNCENHLGLISAAELMRRIYADSAAENKYTLAAAKLKLAIQEEMWNELASCWYWVKLDNGSKLTCNWSTWYPDNVAQVWPELFDIVPINDDKADMVFSQLDQGYAWEDIEEGFCSSVFLDAAKRGEYQAYLYCANVTKTVYPQRAWPWNIQESATLILAFSDYLRAGTQ